MMMSFDGYSFCKPHSASYARVSFQAAYLKTHFPAEFMAAVISNQGGYYSTFSYVSEAKRMGLAVDPPDVRRSDYHWRGRAARDLLVSCWEGCYEGGVYLFSQEGTNEDGTPRLGPGVRLEGLFGFVTVAPRRDGRFDLIAASRRLPAPLLSRNTGQPGEPAFAPVSRHPLALHRFDAVHDRAPARRRRRVQSPRAAPTIAA